jgi:hypothetical protein
VAVTVDGVDTDEPVPPSPAESAGPPVVDDQPPALREYVARMRRQRRYYIAALAIFIIAIVVLVQVVLRTGEIAHATLHSATSPAPQPTSSTTSSSLTQAWHSTDATAGGVPYDKGTVVTYDQHTVSGRDYRTGAATWTYTRTDVSICHVYQEVGITIAIFTDRDGFCDEVDTFNTTSGTRNWYRTLDSNGNTITTTNKPVFSISQYTLMITTPLYIQAVDVSSGEDRWTFIDPSGCTNSSAVQGSGAILIAEHCGDGDHLLFRDPYAGDDNDNKAKVVWRISTNVIPVSADVLTSAIDPKTNHLVAYSATDGKVIGTQSLNPAPASSSGSITAASVNAGELVTIGSDSYLLSASSGGQLWTVPMAGLTTQSANPLAVTAAGIVELDVETGAVIATYPISAPPAGATTVRLGTGFVIAGSSTTVYR